MRWAFCFLRCDLMDIKEHKTIQEQIKILRDRGLTITDEKTAELMLLNYNYYRLSGYSLTLRKNNHFSKGSTFDQIMQIYFFDRELKLLILNYLEEIEIALRTQIAYTLGEINPLIHKEKTLFSADSFFEDTHIEISKCIKRNNNEAFIKHHKTKYKDQLPIWVVVETLSFGALSRLFSCLEYEYQNLICKQYYSPIPVKYLANWTEGLCVLRNICAHKSRLFNRGFAQAFLFPPEDHPVFIKEGYESDHIGKKLFFALVIIDRIHPDKNILSRMNNDLSSLTSQYPFVDIKHYGLRPNYAEIIEKINSKYYKNKSPILGKSFI